MFEALKVGRGPGAWVGLAVVLFAIPNPLAGGPPVSAPGPRVNVANNLDRLVAEEDTDGDLRITVEDVWLPDGPRGDGRFWLRATDGERFEVSGTYYLSNLLQELKLAQDAGLSEVEVSLEHVFENPVTRISRLIRELYWDGLTRRIDGERLNEILVDEKVASSGFRYLYVPASDSLAYDHFVPLAAQRPNLDLRVVRLPVRVTPEFVSEDLAGRHGLLSLSLVCGEDGSCSGTPFVVPGGRFNEMYGWDSYFEALGLLVDGRADLARGMVDNFVYQIEHYGKILNANRTYYLTRSQPPFLTSMAEAVYSEMPQDRASRDWLRTVIRAAVREYKDVWLNADRLTDTGLSRYHGAGSGPPPEVEPGHFDAIYRPHAEALDLDVRVLEEMYKAGRVKIPELDRFFVHDRAVRESGHDTSYRWDWDADRCSDFVTVDLNSLLYKYETDIARILEEELGGELILSDGSVETASAWEERARRRRQLVTEYLWDPEHGIFFDFDYRKYRGRFNYVSAATFYPLWAGLATEEQARQVVRNALPLLETPGGVAASAEESRGPLSDARPQRQWDYPYGWAPHQMIVWRGLVHYGCEDIAHRLIYKWLYTITRNAADYNGTVPEKLDVVRRSHRVFAEYGNVGTEFAYITREGFGWMNASYQVGLALLPDELLRYLERLVPPEWVFR